MRKTSGFFRKTLWGGPGSSSPSGERTVKASPNDPRSSGVVSSRGVGSTSAPNTPTQSRFPSDRQEFSQPPVPSIPSGYTSASQDPAPSSGRSYNAPPLSNSASFSSQTGVYASPAKSTASSRQPGKMSNASSMDDASARLSQVSNEDSRLQRALEVWQLEEQSMSLDGHGTLFGDGYPASTGQLGKAYKENERNGEDAEYSYPTIKARGTGSDRPAYMANGSIPTTPNMTSSPGRARAASGSVLLSGSMPSPERKRQSSAQPLQSASFFQALNTPEAPATPTLDSSDADRTVYVSGSLPSPTLGRSREASKAGSFMSTDSSGDRARQDSVGGSSTATATSGETVLSGSVNGSLARSGAPSPSIGGTRPAKPKHARHESEEMLLGNLLHSASGKTVVRKRTASSAPSPAVPQTQLQQQQTALVEAAPTDEKTPSIRLVTSSPRSPQNGTRKMQDGEVAEQEQAIIPRSLDEHDAAGRNAGLGLSMASSPSPGVTPPLDGEGSSSNPPYLTMPISLLGQPLGSIEEASSSAGSLDVEPVTARPSPSLTDGSATTPNAEAGGNTHSTPASNLPMSTSHSPSPADQQLPGAASSAARTHSQPSSPSRPLADVSMFPKKSLTSPTTVESPGPTSPALMLNGRLSSVAQSGAKGKRASSASLPAPRIGLPAEEGSTAGTTYDLTSPSSASSANLPLDEKAQHFAQKCWDEDETFLKKEKIAEWLGTNNELNALALRCWMDNFNFKGQRVDVAFRKLCEKLYLRAETQQVDRILQSFSSKYWEDSPETLFGSKGKHSIIV